MQAKIEEEVRRKTAELERVHKTLLRSEKMASIGKLAATVAHEINNPLFGILTYARLVLRGLLKHEFPERDEMAEQLRTIERESKRCGDLVKNLLTFSRQAPSNREPNDLNTIVERAISLVKHKLDMQGIELKENLAAGASAGAVRRQPDPAGVFGADGQRVGGHGQRGRAGSRHAARTPARSTARCGSGTGGGIPADVMPRILESVFYHQRGPERDGAGAGRGA